MRNRIAVARMPAKGIANADTAIATAIDIWDLSTPSLRLLSHNKADVRSAGGFTAVGSVCELTSQGGNALARRVLRKSKAPVHLQG